MPAPSKPDLDPRFIAAVDLLRRTGSLEFQLRWSDDEAPVVWLALVRWSLDERGRPTPGDGLVTTWMVHADLDPLRAVLGLCDDAIDGGECQHCGRPSGFDRDFGRMPLPEYVCWTQWDPELATFRRGCEGT